MPKTPLLVQVYRAALPDAKKQAADSPLSDPSVSGLLIADSESAIAAPSVSGPGEP